MKNLLLIEDDPIMGESLVQRFELEGFEVHWCRRLCDAAEVIDQRWSAVVSDVRLPDGLATPWFLELPEAQREVIVLHHLQGLKLAEVAAEIGRSESAVAGLLFRGLKNLHSLLGE